MVIVKKRKRTASVEQLIKALDQFISLLEGQDEAEAIVDLKRAIASLSKQGRNPSETLSALEIIDDAFEDTHELSAYTHARKNGGETWNVADDLYVASTSVLSLAKSLRTSLSKKS